jgi:hypothetical protein
MHELPLDKAKIKKVNGHKYYIFPQPPPHANLTNRPNPKAFANPKDLAVYTGKGSNGSAKLHPDVIGPADLFMTALIEYGEFIDDWSMRNAVIQNGYRPSDESQGREYLRIIKETIAREKPFAGLSFPANLENEAISELGCTGDPRLNRFMDHIAQSPGWSPVLAQQLISYANNVYAPQGCNPHATGYVFDLDFPIVSNGLEVPSLHAYVPLNGDALQTAAGMWINLYSTFFCFDSYDTGIEIWHMEYRRCGPPSIPKAKIPFTA